MSLNVLGSQAIMNVQHGFAMKRPMTATIRQQPLTEKKDRVKFWNRDFDKKTQNPGQLGEIIKFTEVKTNTVGPLAPGTYKRVWNDYKKEQKAKLQKKKLKKATKKQTEPVLDKDNLLRFNKNMVTIEMASKDYEPTFSDAPSAITKDHSQYSQSSSLNKKINKIQIPKLNQLKSSVDEISIIESESEYEIDKPVDIDISKIDPETIKFMSKELKQKLYQIFLRD